MKSQYCRWGRSKDGVSSLPLWSDSTDPSDTAGNMAMASRSSGRPCGNAATAGNLVAPERRRGGETGAWETSACAPFLECDGSETELEDISWFPHRHFTWTCFVLRSSLQCSHCVTGRPFFLISNKGRSVCLQAEDRCPFMHVSLRRATRVR